MAILVTLAGILWWRTGRSGVAIGSSEVVVRNVWRTHKMLWAEIESFELAARPFVGTCARIITHDGHSSWCFGIQSRSKLITVERIQDLNRLNTALRDAQRRLRLKKTKSVPPNLGDPAPRAKRMPRVRARTNPVYWLLYAVAGLAVVFSSAWEIVVPTIAIGATRLIVDHPPSERETS